MVTAGWNCRLFVSGGQQGLSVAGVYDNSKTPHMQLTIAFDVSFQVLTPRTLYFPHHPGFAQGNRFRHGPLVLAK
jgi:hypothetical protein